MVTKTGILTAVVGPDGSVSATITSRGEELIRIRANGRQLDPALKLETLPSHNGASVEYEVNRGQIKNIRLVGTMRTRREQAQASAADPSLEAQPDLRAIDPKRFLNPYAMIAPVPRRAKETINSPFADATPSGHGRYRADAVSGRLRVVMTTATPLLALDASRAADDGKKHFTYTISQRDGRVYLAPSGIKGMLRSAYEAVTNSRYGVFAPSYSAGEHVSGGRLGFRMTVENAKFLVPARVSDKGTAVEMMPGFSVLGSQVTASPELHAAWLPAYKRDGKRKAIVIRGTNREAAHAERVDCWVEKVQHYHFDKAKHRQKDPNPFTQDFTYWRVVEIAPVGSLSPTCPANDRLGGARFPTTDKHRITIAPPRKITGIVSRTNYNASNKHDERVFFVDAKVKKVVADIATGHVASQTDRRASETNLAAYWRDVVASYRAAHPDRDEIHGVRENPIDHRKAVKPWEAVGSTIGLTAWSPHLYNDVLLELQPGTLCFAWWDSNEHRVKGVFPVTIARDLFRASPECLASNDGMLPAASLDELSAADRLFGWVNQTRNRQSPSAWKGQLRISDVRGTAAATTLETPVVLPILGQPKPTQARFYLSNSSTGKSVGDGTERRELYDHRQQSLGRKFYWHHAAAMAPEDWTCAPPAQRHTRLEQGQYREWIQTLAPQKAGQAFVDGPPGSATFPLADPPQEQRNKQNRTITHWIEAKATFAFDIEVTNASCEDFGALVWLLQLPPHHYHRLGYGKPLGFGSVALAIDVSESDVALGSRRADYYRAFGGSGSAPDVAKGVLASRIADGATVATTIKHCRDAFEAACGKHPRFGQILASFRAVARGRTDMAVHYPRTRPHWMDANTTVPPDPRGQSYSWFVENESRRGLKEALPEPTAPIPGLSVPHLPPPRRDG